MKTLAVYYNGWGENWHLGTLVEDRATLLFEYCPEALAQNLQLSPLHFPLRTDAYGDFPHFSHYLPGFIADSLPDGWGLLLMDKLFRKEGLAHPTTLDRLSFMGDRALGALSFVPHFSIEDKEITPDWNLLALAEENLRVQKGDVKIALRELVLTGGSPQGARPKALVYYNDKTEEISSLKTAKNADEKAWLIKFPAQGEHKEVCAIEDLYASLAADCGLEIPAHRSFDLSPKLAAFGVARFDLDNEKRVPMQSLAALLQVDFRLAGSTDYTAFLRATRALTHDEREVEKAFARAVFNVLFHNRDDHPKNLAYRLEQNRRWKLAPAFDLTFSAGFGGQHHMDICGEGDLITRAHLERLAAEGYVKKPAAERIIEEMVEVANTFQNRAKNFAIRDKTLRTIKLKVEACQKRLVNKTAGL